MLLRKSKEIIRELSISAAHGVDRFMYREDYNRIEDLIRPFSMGDKFQAYKLLSLERFLKEYKPKSIIEFGSGASTLILEQFGVRTVSIEESEEWAARTRKALKWKNVEVLVRPSVFIDGNPPEIRYDFKTDERFDLAIIDGPDLTFNGVKRKEAVNSNIFDLDVKHILVDIRKATALSLAKKHPHRLSGLLSGNPVLPHYRYFSVFPVSDC